MLAVLIALALAGCGGSAPPSSDVPQVPPPPDVAGPPADAVRTPTNLASKILKAGTGTRHPRPNSEVTVNYTGWTPDGQTFDSSVTRGEPATFRLDGVIAGWTEGLQMMVEGRNAGSGFPAISPTMGCPGVPRGCWSSTWN